MKTFVSIVSKMVHTCIFTCGRFATEMSVTENHFHSLNWVVLEASTLISAPTIKINGSVEEMPAVMLCVNMALQYWFA